MAIDLVVRWADGRRESTKITNVETACRGWADAARPLGLKHFNGLFPMYISKLDVNEVLGEFQTIQGFCPPEPPRLREDLDDLIAHLSKLKDEKGWEAVLG